MTADPHLPPAPPDQLAVELPDQLPAKLSDQPPARLSDQLSDQLSAQDRTLVTLALGARARAGAVHGAAVRDDDGRTYAAASVALPSLSLTALQAAVALAVSSGASGLEAAVVVGSGELDESSLAVARDLGTGYVLITDASGVAAQRLVL